MAVEAAYSVLSRILRKWLYTSGMLVRTRPSIHNQASRLVAVHLSLPISMDRQCALVHTRIKLPDLATAESGAAWQHYKYTMRFFDPAVHGLASAEGS